MELRTLQAVLIVAVAAASSPGLAADLPAFLHSLSNFNGKVPYNDARICVDPEHGEVFVADGESVRIFNAAGMEIYRFGESTPLATARALAVDEDGDILALVYDYSEAGRPSYRILRFDYRGDPEGGIALGELPKEFAGILPNFMFYKEGRIWLVSRSQMLLVVVDREGRFQKGMNLADVLEIAEKDRPGVEIVGFSIDRAGNLLMTIPVLFRAFVISPDGAVASFGKVGSAPGLFGVVAGIVADDHGNVLVADRLRSVVMMFDRNRDFITEFGYMGLRPENLVRPDDLVVGQAGRVYVTQAMNRGVSVFSVTPK
jgi:hypothetical protein